MKIKVQHIYLSNCIKNEEYTSTSKEHLIFAKGAVYKKNWILLE